jgi:hypothetical protein
MSFPDDTNVEHPFQGKIRFAPLDVAALRERCAKDYGSTGYKLVLTHADQLDTTARANLYSFGPAFSDVTPTRTMAA